jgi:small subunit ribosomal protein S2
MAKDTNINIEEMVQLGVNFGHKVSRLHPKMKPYITGVKNNIHIIDLEKTVKELEKALKFIDKVVSEGKTILFVGTKIQIRSYVKAIADECSFPYVTERWLGGTFTNFETISKRVGYFKDLEAKRASGEFEKYTKKERMKIDKEIKILKTKFEGVRNMTKLPDVVIVFGVDKDIACIREAKIKGIKIIALCDTNINPDIADYPIPANDDALSSVQYILEKIKETILNSKQVKV